MIFEKLVCNFWSEKPVSVIREILQERIQRIPAVIP
jgi:hypothetical protein